MKYKVDFIGYSYEDKLRLQQNLKRKVYYGHTTKHHSDIDYTGSSEASPWQENAIRCFEENR